MGAAPIERRGPQLIVVIDDPTDFSRCDALRAIEADREVVFHVGFKDEIAACIECSYGLRSDVNVLLRELSGDESTGAVDEPSDEEDEGEESDSAIIKLANQIIIDAFQRGASDIHIEPYGKEDNTRIRFRIDGDCVRYQDIPPAFRNPLVARFKIMAKLDIFRTAQAPGWKDQVPHARIAPSSCASPPCPRSTETKTWSCASWRPPSPSPSTKWA